MESVSTNAFKIMGTSRDVGQNYALFYGVWAKVGIGIETRDV